MRQINSMRSGGLTRIVEPWRGNRAQRRCQRFTLPHNSDNQQGCSGSLNKAADEGGGGGRRGERGSDRVSRCMQILRRASRFTNRCSRVAFALRQRCAQYNTGALGATGVMLGVCSPRHPPPPFSCYCFGTHRRRSHSREGRRRVGRNSWSHNGKGCCHPHPQRKPRRSFPRRRCHFGVPLTELLPDPAEGEPEKSLLTWTKDKESLTALVKNNGCGDYKKGTKEAEPGGD
jgi:hypothetical protein